MMSRHVLGWIVVGCAIAWLAVPAQAELSLSGSLANLTRIRLYQGTMPEGYDWDLLMLMARLNTVGRAMDDSRTARLLVDMDLRYDPTGVFDETNDLEWRLREAVGGFYSDYVSFELGKKIYVWGMADEFNPTDLINPEDLRWMFTLDKTERKIGVYSANLTLSYDAFAWQNVFAPVFEPNLLPASGSDWEPWELQLLRQLASSFPDFVDFQADDRPALALKNANFASRFTGTAGPVDFAVVYFNGFDPLPVYDVAINIDPNAFAAGEKPLHVRERYQRYNAYGGSLAFTVKSFGFRAEGAYYTERVYANRPDPNLLQAGNLVEGYQSLLRLQDFDWQATSRSFSAAGGFDWREGTKYYLNMQYVHTQLLDHAPAMTSNELEGIVTLKFNAKFLEDDLDVGVNGAYNVFHEDWYGKPYIGYLFTADFRGELGAQFFGGDQETRFGNFDYNDFGYLQVRYAF